VETDKAVVEIPAPRSGVLLHQGGPAGTVIQVGEILAVIGNAGETWEGGEPAAPIVGTLGEEAEQLATVPAPVEGPVARVQALPVVRKLARDLGLDVEAVEGSGPGGRITREDVEAAARGRDTGADERVKLSKTRRTIAEHLSRSWREIPHVTTFDDADGTKLLEARRTLGSTHGRPVPLEALVVQAVLPALAAFPEFNATLEGDELILRKRYDIGVAVDTPDGLLVPVIARADTRSLLEVADEISRLSESAQRRSLRPDELRGATFTVSNIGAVGGGHGTPIVPYGTTAILSFGRAQDKPVVRSGRVETAPLIPLSLSYDHRVIDGALGRRFIAMVVENLQEPSRFLA